MRYQLKERRFSLFSLWFFLGVLGVLAIQVSAQKINLPPVTRVKLENGVQVVLMAYRRAPTLTVTAVFPGGSFVESEEKAGLAALTAEVMRRGTEKRNAQEIAEAIDFLGGSLDTGAGDDRLAVTLDVLAKDAEAGLDLFADILKNPTFPEAELTRARDLQVAGLQAIAEDPGSLADYVLPGVVYGKHPYGLVASIDSLNRITQNDLRVYYQRFVTPGKMILVAVGDFTPSEMLTKFRERFGDWKQDDAPSEGDTAARPVAQTKTERVLVDKPDATQTQVRFARTAMPRNHPDFFASQVAVSILGGGFTSRLTDEIRVNKSLTYGIGASFDRKRFGGDFSVSTFTKIETTRALLDAVRDVLRKTATQGFTAAELKKVQGYLTGLFAIRVQIPQALTAQLADIAFYGLPDDYLQTYLLKLRAVTLADINRIAKTYFAPDTMSAVLVAPQEKIKTQLSGLGETTIRSAAEIGK